MKDYIFLIDLDSTITKTEILPFISRKSNKIKIMKEITEKTMMGDLPFKESFLKRVDLLKDVPVDIVQEIIRNIPLNNELVNFIKKNKDRCYIVTGNLDVWIESLINDLGMENNCFSSKAQVKDNRLEKVTEVIDKTLVVKQLDHPFVAIGDGDNDAAMISLADIGIGFGGVRKVAPSILECATHAIYQEEKLCEFSRRLL